MPQLASPVQTALDLLIEERAKIDAAIQALQAAPSLRLTQYINNGVHGKRRGRKGMNAAEREQVSARMKKYWAKRRKRSNGNAEAATA